MHEQAYDVMVYRYDLGAPVDWAHDCEQQLIAQQRLWNELVDIDLEARKRYYELLRTSLPTLAQIETQLAVLQEEKEALWEQLRSARARTRSRTNDDPQKQERIRQIRAEIGALLPQLKAERVKARQVCGPQLAQIEAWRKAQVKAVRQTDHCGLWWPNYNAVCLSYDVARNAAMKSGATLRKRAYDGEGRLTCQFIGGVRSQELLAGEASEAQIGPALPGMRERGAGNPRQCRSLTITVYTRKEDRRTVRRTCTFPLWMHRPLPEEARVQQLTVVRRRVASSYQWSVSLTVRVPRIATTTAADAACAVHLGWRKVRDGLRVATAAGTDGAVRHLVLPAVWLQRREYADTLQSKIDERLNMARAELARLPASAAPAELQPLLAAALRGPRLTADRLSALAEAWRAHPHWERDAADATETHRRMVKRMRDEMSSLRQKLQNRRLDMYRVFAAGLRRRYGSIYIDDMALDKAARLVVDDTESPLPAPARRLRVLAAPHALRSALRNAIATPTAGHTAVCASCGHRNDVPADDIFVTCSGCGVVYDRDENHARNLLAAGRSAGAPRQDITAGARVARRERIERARVARKSASLLAADYRAVNAEPPQSLPDGRTAAGTSEDEDS